MGSQLTVVLLTAFAALVLVAAFGQFKGGRTTATIVLIVAAAGVLRFAAATDRYLHPWDERYHALVAKNMVEEPLRPTLYKTPVLRYDHRHWYENHIWLHKPPATLWAMAASMRLFGITELAIRLPSILLSTFAILCTWSIGRRVFDEQTGVLAASLHAIDGQLLDLAGGRMPTDHVDTMTVAFIAMGCSLAFAGGSERPWMRAIGTGLVTGLALLTKSFVGLLIPVVWLVARWHRDQVPRVIGQVIVIGIVAAAIWLPWQVHVYRSFPQEAKWEAEYGLRHFVEVLEGHEHPPWYYFERLARTSGWFALAAVAWFIGVVFSSSVRPGRRAILVWIALPYGVFSLAATKMPAYTAVAAPAVFLVVAAFWWRMREVLRRASNRPLFGWCLITVLVLTLLLPGIHSVERLKLHGGYDRDPQWAETIRRLPQRLGEQPTVIFESSHPIETMFYTDYIAYSRAEPRPRVADRLRREGYRVLVDEGGSVPREAASGESRAEAIAGEGLSRRQPAGMPASSSTR
jgi:4-amino-4-deoxy-L-arabinose transferase